MMNEFEIIEEIARDSVAMAKMAFMAMSRGARAHALMLSNNYYERSIFWDFLRKLHEQEMRGTRTLENFDI